MPEKAATPARRCVFKKQAEYVPSMQTVGGWGEKKGEELIKPYMLIKLHFQFRKYPRKYLQFLSPTLQAKTTLKAGRRKLVPPPFATIASAFSSPSGLVRTAPPSSNTTEVSQLSIRSVAVRHAALHTPAETPCPSSFCKGQTQAHD